MSKMPTTPLVVFIVVSWNNQDILGDCFQSIVNQTYNNHKTVLIDNGSKDDSISFTKENYPWVDVYDAKANLGFAKGNNVAMQYAAEKYPEVSYFVFLNSDARLRSDWLDVLVHFAQKKPRGAVFQSTTLDYYNHDVVDSTHIYISDNGSGTQANWRSPYLGEHGPRKVFGANAAAALISKKFIDAQPFSTVFDETLFMYLEDVDLSARATVMGWDNYLVPGTAAYHMGSASSGKTPGFSLYMTYRNNVAILLKNIPFKMLIRIFPRAVQSDYHTIRHLKRIGQASGIRKLLKGRLVGFFRIPLYIPGIWKLRAHRKAASIEYLEQLMRTGE